MLLLEYDLPTQMVNLIMECVTTVQYSILINGGLTTMFKAKKGLRQGDPMSPYLFVLVMEYLHRTLQQLRHEPQFNYHPRLSGLNANLDKSSIYIAGVSDQTKSQILCKLQMQQGELPFKYLGVPLSTRKLSVHQCLPLVERMIARVKCWTTKFLLYSGRLQFIKSVLFELQIYWAQIFLLPKKIITMVTTVCRTFLWTGSSNCSRKALVAWEKVCMPKAAGGLSVIDGHLWNKAALSKLLWALGQKKDKLWIVWIHTFYIKRKDLYTMTTPKQTCWIIRKIFDARTWYKDDVGPTGGRKKPEASIKNNYVTLRPQYPQVEWKHLVQVKGMMPRHQFILWMTLQRKLSTIDRVLKWGIQVDANCVLCNTGHIENFDHLFYACPYSSYVWKAMLNWLGYHRQVGSWEYEVKWMISRVKNSRPRAEILGFCFAAIIYNIWIERNDRRFNAKKGSTTQRLKEIAIQVHIEGQRHSNWKPHLDQLIGYPN